MSKEISKFLKSMVFAWILVFVFALIVPGTMQQVHAEDEVCTHGSENDEGNVTTEPTCEEKGVMTYTCSLCGETYTEEIDANGHSFSDKYTIEQATASKNGRTYKKCTVKGCNAKDEETVIPKIASQKLSYTTKVYSGKAITAPSVTVKDSEGNKLVSGTDYSVDPSSQTKVGRYTVTITYKGNYEGTKKLYYNIVPKKPASASAAVSSKTKVGTYDDVKFTWKSSTGVDGYLVYYKKASASKWTGPVVTTKTSYTKKDLSDGVKYTFKVIPYFKSKVGTTKYKKYYSSEQYKTASVTTLEAGRFITKNGKKYYEYYKGGYSKGHYAKSKFLTINKKTYYFNKSGVMHTGWLKLSGDYYYFDRSTGVQKKNCTVDDIKIKSNGKATATTLNKNKMDLMITARKTMQEVTKSTDSKSQKLKKVFKWVMDKPYKRYRRLHEAKQNKGWEVTFANDIFKNGKGCCVSEACAFAFLAKECGYTKVYVADDTGHAWAEIDGRVYDTLFAVAKDYDTYYNGTYKKAKLYRHSALRIS